jgi:hypothetical protein
LAKRFFFFQEDPRASIFPAEKKAVNAASHRGGIPGFVGWDFTYIPQNAVQELIVVLSILT